MSAAQSEDLSLLSGATRRKDRSDSYILSSDHHMCAVLHMCAHTMIIYNNVWENLTANPSRLAENNN